MTTPFLQLPVAEQRALFQEAAARKRVSPVILEKDFWVCWMLDVIFSLPCASAFVFKGGTSLSKVFGVIDRFSEDIDVSLSPAFAGLEDLDLQPLPSKGQANKWMKRAEQACYAAVEQRVLPALRAELVRRLGDEQGVRLRFEVESGSHSPVVFFDYPTTQPSAFEYLRRSVKLEFGSLTDQQPTERHLVRSWLEETLPGTVPATATSVIALDVVRTFWEKATILHAEWSRPTARELPLRYARHYADTAAILRSTWGPRALVDAVTGKRVVDWKSRFFASGWANYEAACPPTFHLIPPEHRIPALRRDYLDMREMFVADPPPFDDIVRVLRDAEAAINRPGVRW